MARSFIRWFEDIGAGDIESVGGKNASLGEMARNLGRSGIKVPLGFAITVDGDRHFMEANNLEQLIATKLAELKCGKVSSAEIGSAVRAAIESGEWPKDLADAICHAYRDLSRRLRVEEADVAVRSSATAEDLPEASFAGQQASFLNIRGEAALLDAARRCFASLFTQKWRRLHRPSAPRDGASSPTVRSSADVQDHPEGPETRVWTEYWRGRRRRTYLHHPRSQEH